MSSLVGDETAAAAGGTPVIRRSFLMVETPDYCRGDEELWRHGAARSPSPARSCVLMTSDCPAAKLQPAPTIRTRLKVDNEETLFQHLKLLLLLLHSELVLVPLK